jgi:predicted N-acetyltransferase YhbS
MPLSLRTESPQDFAAVEQVVEAAFANDPHGDHTEHLLVARLRHSEAFVPELSIVALLDGHVVGHILFTRILVKNEQYASPSLTLAPVSVLPSYQGQGIGSKLIEYGHDIARDLGYDSVVLLGHAGYYPRFGYEQADRYGIALPFDVPKENVMVLALREGALEGLRGTVEYAPEFFE